MSSFRGGSRSGTSDAGGKVTMSAKRVGNPAVDLNTNRICAWHFIGIV